MADNDCNNKNILDSFVFCRCKKWIKSVEDVPGNDENENEDGTDSTTATVCYYLLPEVVRSTWRRLTSDEIWLYQDGGCLKIHMIDANGIYSTAVLGSTIRHKEARYEVLVPAGVWGAAEVLHGGEFTLISCVVAPGFDWKGLELGQEEELVTSFPHLADVIKYFCKH
ncbi:Hypp4095 [Branchiostoma lanceolatum]|uniref:Hypp4095 protein n=1 Tax=Branchiostoma lanceolatum TaxID=7740 RepID=A0A8K0EZP7_BRALA|nr:Hypp4095 [Branchiostoma lanceolatum]